LIESRPGGEWAEKQTTSPPPPVIHDRFTKALDHIKTIRKERTADLKVEAAKLDHLKKERERADRVSSPPALAWAVPDFPSSTHAVPTLHTTFPDADAQRV
jgi:hypothetical protein